MIRSAYGGRRTAELFNPLDKFAVRYFAEKIHLASAGVPIGALDEGSEPRSRSGFEAHMLRTLAAVIGAEAVDHLLDGFGSFWGIIECSPARLQEELERFGVAGSKELRDLLNDAIHSTKRLAEIIEAAHRNEMPVIETTADLVQHFRRQFRRLEREQLRVVLLDRERRLTHSIPVATGSFNRVQAPVREMIAPVLQFRASAWAIGHNHPAGDAAPSTEDYSLTRQLNRIAELIDIPLIDHIIIANSACPPHTYYSMNSLLSTSA